MFDTCMSDASLKQNSSICREDGSTDEIREPCQEQGGCKGTKKSQKTMSAETRIAIYEAEKIAEIADFRELTDGYQHTYKAISRQGFFTNKEVTDWVSMNGTDSFESDLQEPNHSRFSCSDNVFSFNEQSEIEILGRISIPNVEERGIKLRQLRAIIANVERRCIEERWEDEKGRLLTPDTVTLHDVNRYIIKPFTVRSRKSLVEELPSTLGPQRPRFFSNHWWGESVKEFVSQMEKRLKEFGDGMTEETPIWICAYANNQWDLDMGRIEETRESMVETESLHRRLREETEARQKAESQAEEMSAMVKQAKTLVLSNERLHSSLHAEMEKRKELHNKLEDLKGRIRVYVRVRPMVSRDDFNKKEALTKEDNRVCVMYDECARDNTTKTWEFDQIFGGEASDGNKQEDIFKDTKNLVTSSIDGFNVCIFAYGQTGSGKTYTMFGPSGTIPQIDNIHELDEKIGLAPRSAIELFKILEERSETYDYSISVTMFELYNDNIIDLLAQSKGDSSQPLRVKLAKHSESGLVEVDGAVTEEVDNVIDLLKLFKTGSETRSTAATKMNADSSRSHLIISVVTKMVKKTTGRVTRGKLTICDLAGSERVGKSGSKGRQLKEAQSINKSLSALNGVINSLTTGSKHIPYRNHPLTMLMSDSIGGNSKTLMFVCCSPESGNCSESTNSLDFAKRCKNVTNNVKPTAGDILQIKKLKAEVARLKKQQYETLKKKRTSSLMPRPQRPMSMRSMPSKKVFRF
mmetsp:Transcript_21885/g.33272  ORF Transcript_21885/g.33272 Transcript_21885/m.33272 type:complete len:749 (-) Transcript_21885:209-2455(-)